MQRRWTILTSFVKTNWLIQGSVKGLDKCRTLVGTNSWSPTWSWENFFYNPCLIQIPSTDIWPATAAFYKPYAIGIVIKRVIIVVIVTWFVNFDHFDACFLLVLSQLLPDNGLLYLIAKIVGEIILDQVTPIILAPVQIPPWRICLQRTAFFFRKTCIILRRPNQASFNIDFCI